MKKIKILKPRIINSSIYQNIITILSLKKTDKFLPAACSFYVILSLIPCLILVELMLSLINLSLDQSFSFFKFLFKDNQIIHQTIKEIISTLNTKDAFSLSFSLIIIIYLSSKGTSFFIYQTHDLYQEEKIPNTFYHKKILPMIITLILLVFLSILMVFLIIFDNFIHLNNLLFLNFIKYIYILIIIFFYIIFLYTLTNQKNKKFKDYLPGTIISTIGIGGGVFFYYIYIVYISSSLTYYGPLGLIAILFLICYYSSYILFIGIEVNYFFNKIKKPTFLK